jgi:hypothetical protein
MTTAVGSQDSTAKDRLIGSRGGMIIELGYVTSNPFQSIEEPALLLLMVS